MEGFAANDAYLSGIEIEQAMSNSFGFGGNCTSIIFKKV
jgi:3-oxoacyl-(acyl-carrier-protein) synthase